MAVRSEPKDKFPRRSRMHASEIDDPGRRSNRLVTLLVAAAVAIAFADSSIVVLALPQLYGDLQTSIEGVAWVVTAYNAAVAAAAFALFLFVHRLRARAVLAVGLVVFLVASIACALADSLSFLVAARSVQGVGAALLLAGSLPVLAVLTGSAGRGAALWTLAGTFGAALGPALGGVLTQGLDWRAIFAFQAPVAALGLLGAVKARVELVAEEGYTPRSARSLPANICLGLVFGALVGVLFLSVLLVISVWGHSPISGAAIVSVLPAATLAVRPLGRRLPGATAVQGGTALLLGGLLGLALLPSTNVGFVVWALALCGAGLGLAVPVLSNAALDLRAGLTRSGTLTIGIRHLGLVLALALIAPVLASTLPAAGDRAMLRGTAVILDAPIGLSKKIPIALELRSAFNDARDGQRPDLSKPFDEHGAGTDEELASTRDELIGVIEGTITRAFRPAFALSAAFAALALALALIMRRRLVA
ncbi:MAG TPA: MFS transporter [Gaiellaceae bacterium]|jgi:predicted MFS family arabinose efflux permease